MPQFIYTMKGLGKVHQPDTRVLDDIWLSFYFGAKIGVLGLNGSGKSSLLRIMAGEDTHFLGEAFAGEGLGVGEGGQDRQGLPGVLGRYGSVGRTGNGAGTFGAPAGAGNDPLHGRIARVRADGCDRGHRQREVYRIPEGMN